MVDTTVHFLDIRKQVSHKKKVGGWGDKALYQSVCDTFYDKGQEKATILKQVS